VKKTELCLSPDFGRLPMDLLLPLPRLPVRWGPRLPVVHRLQLDHLPVLSLGHLRLEDTLQGWQKLYVSCQFRNATGRRSQLEISQFLKITFSNFGINNCAYDLMNQY